MDFYWHSADWDNTSWVKFASDTNGSDGWWGILTTQPPIPTGSAFYILATNNGGGSKGVLVTGLVPDYSAPSSAMNSLPSPVNTTAVLLTWTAQDLQNDIDHFDVQYRFNLGTWTNWDQQPGPGERSAWFIGQPGAYEFHMRAVDKAGNQEAFPNAAQASVQIGSACSADAMDQAGDGARGSASVQAANTSVLHRLCQNDTDWVKFDATEGQEMMIFAASKGGGAAVRVRLTNSANTTQYLDFSSANLGTSAVARWTVPADGTYYLEVTSKDARVWGSDVQYALYVGDPHVALRAGDRALISYKLPKNSPAYAGTFLLGVYTDMHPSETSTEAPPTRMACTCPPCRSASTSSRLGRPISKPCSTTQRSMPWSAALRGPGNRPGRWRPRRWPDLRRCPAPGRTCARAYPSRAARGRRRRRTFRGAHKPASRPSQSVAVHSGCAPGRRGCAPG